TLLLLTNGNAVSQALFKSLPYDPVNDFAMISTVGYFSLVIVTGAKSPYRSIKDVIAAAKASPGKLNIGTISPGGTQHLAGELFRSTAGIDALVVPHKTTGEVIIGVRNGSLDIGVDFIAPLVAAVKAGDMRALAVSAGKRFPGLPEVPTVIEAGVAGYDDEVDSCDRLVKNGQQGCCPADGQSASRACGISPRRPTASTWR
ncbi:MAG: Bug family tripartite tricarboxylate transporter substrate binding protein, partial [Burkholderiales bacterium]